MGVPLNHPFSWDFHGFSLINQPFGGSPICGNLHVFLNVGSSADLPGRWVPRCVCGRSRSWSSRSCKWIQAAQAPDVDGLFGAWENLGLTRPKTADASMYFIAFPRCLFLTDFGVKIFDASFPRSMSYPRGHDQAIPQRMWSDPGFPMSSVESFRKWVD